MKQDNTFYTAKELAEKLRVNIITIYHYIKAGKLKTYRIEEEFRIDKKEFEKFLKRIKTKKTVFKTGEIKVIEEKPQGLEVIGRPGFSIFWPYISTSVKSIVDTSRQAFLDLSNLNKRISSDVSTLLNTPSSKLKKYSSLIQSYSSTLRKISRMRKLRYDRILQNNY